MTKTYTIQGKTITCLKCGRTSHHVMDVEQLYCGNCHAFHITHEIEHKLKDMASMKRS